MSRNNRRHSVAHDAVGVAAGSAASTAAASVSTVAPAPRKGDLGTDGAAEATGGTVAVTLARTSIAALSAISRYGWVLDTVPTLMRAAPRSAAATAARSARSALLREVGLPVPSYPVTGLAWIGPNASRC